MTDNAQEFLRVLFEDEDDDSGKFSLSDSYGLEIMIDFNHPTIRGHLKSMGWIAPDEVTITPIVLHTDN